MLTTEAKKLKTTKKKPTTTEEPRQDIEELRTNFFAEARRETARIITNRYYEKEKQGLRKEVLALQRELQMKNNIITKLREAIFAQNDTIRALPSTTPIPEVMVDQWAIGEKMV